MTSSISKMLMVIETHVGIDFELIAEFMSEQIE
jgi:hypothetical protein